MVGRWLLGVEGEEGVGWRGGIVPEGESEVWVIVVQCSLCMEASVSNGGGDYQS